ncbi:MAG: carbon-nitrogen hydrolase family protein [Nocardioides sp.]|uniref:carbon-nitrogen hydrolase family protein n=1 Tax=Nocardioides sp. TaxID=35761 RepID=UPI0039E6674B
MRIGLAQIRAGVDIDRNLAAVDSACRSAAAQGAELILLPEYAMYDKPRVDASFARIAQTLEGPFVTAVAELARELGAVVVVGVVERRPAAAPFNTLVALGADGSLLARYRKNHLYDANGFTESAWISAPEAPEAVTFHAGGVRVGLLACYDLRFPEQSRALVDAGAELLAVCSAWVPGPEKVAQWQTLARARAIENTSYVAAVCQAAPLSIGTSMLVDPQGRDVVVCGGGPETRVAEIETERIASARERDRNIAVRRFATRPR